ncbi:MAG: GNAT family N-acetyltransferase [Nitrospinota bacterium]
MALEFTIREAVSSDIPVLAKNNQALANETEDIQLDSETLLSGVTHALEREDCHYFVAESKGKILGQTMVTYEWSDWRDGVMWWLQSVYILPDYRNQGVFRAIFNHIEKLARNRPDVKALRLYVMQDNQSGKSTYSSLGMNDSGYLVYEKVGLNDL